MLSLPDEVQPNGFRRGNVQTRMLDPTTPGTPELCELLAISVRRREPIRFGVGYFQHEGGCVRAAAATLLQTPPDQFPKLEGLGDSRQQHLTLDRFAGELGFEAVPLLAYAPPRGFWLAESVRSAQTPITGHALVMWHRRVVFDPQFAPGNPGQPYTILAGRTFRESR
jgi:hypothetical protein